jgi:transmembrane sensor
MNSEVDIQECAARWLLRKEEASWSAADELAFQTWIGASMAHRAAYWRLEHGWRKAARLSALQRLPNERATTRRDWWPLALAASLAVAAVPALNFWATNVEPERPPSAKVVSFATVVGSRKKITLEDGSRVELNTNTLVHAGVSSTRREFWLERGEAYFEVTRAPRVPFVVHAMGKRIVVLGTKFSVRADDGKVRVGVLEGRVTISAASDVATVRSATIGTGDLAVSKGHSTLVVANSIQQVENGVLWRSGMLTFEGATLEEIAAEFNRYNKRKLVVESPELAKLRMGGTFQASNLDGFVRLISDSYGLVVREEADRVQISADS